MKRVLIILITSVIIVTVGVGVAYYNTSSLGYDDTVLFSVEENAVTVLGNPIEYDKIKESIKKIVDFLPDKIITI